MAIDNSEEVLKLLRAELAEGDFTLAPTLTAAINCIEGLRGELPKDGTEYVPVVVVELENLRAEVTMCHCRLEPEQDCPQHGDMSTRHVCGHLDRLISRKIDAYRGKPDGTGLWGKPW